MTKKCKLHKIKNIYIKNDIISTLEGRRNGNSVHAILRIAHVCAYYINWKTSMNHSLSG